VVTSSSRATCAAATTGCSSWRTDGRGRRARPRRVTGDGRIRSPSSSRWRTTTRVGASSREGLTKIKVDDAAIQLVKKQGHALDDVPPEGAVVKLAATGNMSTAHLDRPDVGRARGERRDRRGGRSRRRPRRRGIDFLSCDIAQPVRETGGAIVEVNAAPGFRMHTHPTRASRSSSRSSGRPAVPPGTPSRIPIVAVTGSNGKTTTVRMIAHVFKGMGFRVGLTSTDGIYIDERLVKRADASGPKSAQMVLQNPRVDFAVFRDRPWRDPARGARLRQERRRRGHERHRRPPGLKGIDTIEQLAAVKQVVVEAVPKSGWPVLKPTTAGARDAQGVQRLVVLFSMDRRTR